MKLIIPTHADAEQKNKERLHKRHGVFISKTKKAETDKKRGEKKEAELVALQQSLFKPQKRIYIEE